MCNVFCPFSAVEYRYNRAMIKRSLQIASFHLTRLFELRKSCWEIRDSQRVWKSQVSDDFVSNPFVLAKQSIGCDKTTRCSRYFKGHFSDYVPRNLFFFPWNFENVRRNFISVREIRGNLRENRRIIPKRRGKPKRFSKRNWRREKKPQILFSRRHQNLVKNDLPF